MPSILTGSVAPLGVSLPYLLLLLLLLPQCLTSVAVFDGPTGRPPPRRGTAPHQSARASAMVTTAATVMAMEAMEADAWTDGETVTETTTSEATAAEAVTELATTAMETRTVAKTVTEAAVGAETETETKPATATETQTETKTVTESVTVAETETMTSTATNEVTATVKEAGTATATAASVGVTSGAATRAPGSEPDPSVPIAPVRPSTGVHFCRNATFGNMTVIVLGTAAVLVTGSAERLDLAWVTAQCPLVTSLTVRLGVTGVSGDVACGSQLTELDLSENRLETIPESVLRLEGLRRLALAHNSISKLPQDLLETMFHRLDEVDVRGNPLRCSRDLVWLDRVVSIQYRDQLTCIGSRPGPLGLMDRKPLGRVIAKIQRVDASCPTRCRCKLEDFKPTQVVVGCGGAGLRSLPTSLPDSVVMLNVSDNQIRSAHLCQLTSVYRTLSTVDLSHNQLTDITVEDVQCAGKLGRLDLRHNQLTRLPWQQLGRALRSGVRLNKVLLSHNPWSCEYEGETMHFWNFLVGHHRFVLDFKRILCSEDGTVHAGKEVVAIPAGGDMWRWSLHVNPLDIVIVIEVLLLLLLAVKFNRDYRAYRLDGTLPWPVRPRNYRLKHSCW